MSDADPKHGAGDASELAARIPLAGYPRRDDATMLARAEAFEAMARTRRTVRHFSREPVADEVLARCLATAGSAPSGANLQPWRFVVVREPEIKRQVREAAEAEERAFYEHRAPATWRAALAPLGVSWRKPFLEEAPALIAIFEQRWVLGEDGAKQLRYYPTESVGIATGMLILALHQAGLATLTHTPSPMGFLSELLQRPSGERPFLLLVVGHPAPGTTVPALKRLPLDDIAIWR